jgi:peroxin-4
MSTQRLAKEYKSIQKEANPEVSLNPIDSDLFHWSAIIKGPKETAFEGGEFELELVVPKNYPLEPPKVRFLTPVFHPNVHFKVRVPNSLSKYCRQEKSAWTS